VASITSSSALSLPVHLVKEILTISHGAKRLEVKALFAAMAQVPPIPKGGSLDLIMTRTTLVGTLGGSLHLRHRNALLACIAEVSLIMGKLRVGSWTSTEGLSYEEVGTASRLDAEYGGHQTSKNFIEAEVSATGRIVWASCSY
jgi:hypothetical protein